MTVAALPPLARAVPRRDLAAKVWRRWVQARPAAPVTFRSDRAILSLTFDDFPRTAATQGARLLDRLNVRGTFYGCGSLMNGEAEGGRAFTSYDLLRLAADGHEIGCHGFSHADYAATPLPIAFADCLRNGDVLRAAGLWTPLVSFAFPYGEATFELKQALRGRYVTGRGIVPGLNRGPGDAMQLKAVPLYEGQRAARAFGILDALARRGGWLIAFTHDVGSGPSRFGVTPETLRRFVERAQALGVEVRSIAEAFSKARVEPAP